MSDELQTNPYERPQDDPYDRPLPDISIKSRPILPPWVARRVLKPNEKTTWVRGPRFNPTWEKVVTHPGLFVVALILGGLCVAAGLLSAGSLSNISPLPCLAAMGFVFGSIYVLGFSNAYFTRLVVTTHRLLITQGYEVCRRWSLDQLPPSLVRYRQTQTGEAVRILDLERMKTMLGDSPDHFVDSKTIRNFGKQLDQFKNFE